MSPSPKYSILEIERRWLVALDEVGPLGSLPARDIEDRYIHGTHLRLRMVREIGKPTIYKLCKKYGKISALSEPITNLYLTEAEYGSLLLLPAAAIRKARYTLAGGALDVFQEPSSNPAVFEVEFSSEDEAASYAPPSFVRREITNDPEYSGAAFARKEGC